MKWNEKVLKLLQEKDISQKELAQMTSIAESSVSRYVNYSDLQKSELPASTTTALATMIRNSMSYTMSTGV